MRGWVHVDRLIEPWEKFAQKSSFFCPFGQSKMRQFAIVWLPSQSSCMWHSVHHTHPSVAQYTHPYFPLAGYFWHSRVLVELPSKTDKVKLDFNWTTTCFSQLVLGRVTLKYKTLVFIATVALSYTNWPCWFKYGKAAGQSRSETSASSGRQDVVYGVLPEGGARHTSALNFTCVQEDVMIGHCQVM